MPNRPSQQPITDEHNSGEIGCVVAIFVIGNTTTELIFEGYATVLAACPHDRFFFRVRFVSETVDRIRLVLPSSPHEDPALFAEALRELTRTRGLNPWPEFWSD